MSKNFPLETNFEHFKKQKEIPNQTFYIVLVRIGSPIATKHVLTQLNMNNLGVKIFNGPTGGLEGGPI